MPAISGRPDGRLSKYIYADGFGGVCRDMRYSAYGLTLTDFAEADQRVKNGTYRGFEKAVFSKVAPRGTLNWTTVPMELATGVSNRVGWGSNINLPAHIGSKVHIGTKTYTVIAIEDTSQVVLDRAPDLTGYTLVGNQSGWNFYTGQNIVLEVSLPSSIGGSFMTTDVIGSPSNILATPQLANGWQGSWIPVPSTTVAQALPLTRKALDSGSLLYGVRTENNGQSWGSQQWAYSSTTNTLSENISTMRVCVVTYQAFAKQTKPSANAVVYGGQSGIGVVQQSSDYRTHARGALMESLLGLIPKNNTNVTYGDKALTQVTIIVANGLLPVTDGYTVEHQAISLGIPVNSSPAFKALNYNVAVNQQGFINYAYTELKHNGANWGDDGKVAIVDNQSTKTDLNGNTVLVGTAQLVEPLGWIKNKV